MTKRKTILLFAAAFLLFALAAGLLYLKSVKEYKDAVNQMTFEPLNMANISDGVYIGECDVNFIYAKVAVTVKNGQMQTIDLIEHRNDRGASAEGIIGQIVEAQSLEVDAISGATNSSKVIKKAVENAIQSAA